jgi:hypothetical protein
MRKVLLASIAMLAGPAVAQQQPPTRAPHNPAQHTQAATPTARPRTDAQLIASAMAAAPRPVSGAAAIMAMNADGSMRTLRPGSNGWTCMPDDPGTPGPDPMCLDANGMEWLHALMSKTEPPNKVGFVFMLVEGSDASNTDAFASAPAPGRRWIKTGPHVMIVGGEAVRSMVGYPRTPDPDPSRPYMMFIGTPYEHLMVPVR